MSQGSTNLLAAVPGAATKQPEKYKNSSLKVKCVQFYSLIEPCEIHYDAELYQNLNNNFQVLGNFLSRLNAKVKRHQNLITCKGTITNIATKIYQFLVSSFKFLRGHTDTRTDTTENNNCFVSMMYCYI